MRGYWHITALSISLSIFTVIIGKSWILIFGITWLILLKVFKRLSLLPFIVSLTALLFFSFYIPTQSESPYLETNEKRQFTGQVVQTLHQTPEKVQFTLQEKSTKQKFIILYFKNKDHSVDQTNLNAIKYGANCTLVGKLQVPQEARNPGQFDFKNYLVNQGITSQIIVNELNHVQCSGASMFHPFLQLRGNLLYKVRESINSDMSAWLQALVLGDRTHLEEKVIQLFQRWGLSHLLAISGLHVGIIVGSLYFIFVRLGILTKESTEIMLISFLPIYAIVAGSEPSVLRAVLMVMIFLVINKLRLDLQMQDTISLVFILLIVFNPYIIYHIGFQFSFLVTFGLILSRQWLSQTKSIGWQLLILSFVSQMVILPLQINYFHIFQPLSIILNFFVVPYFSLFVIPAMFFVLPAIYIAPKTINFIMSIIESIHEIVLSSLFFIDEHLYFPYVIGEFPLSFTIVYYVILGLLFIHLQNNELKKAVNDSVLLVGLMTTLVVQPYFSPQGMITMLDVGQGDAFVIELPYRKGVIFVDAAATVKYGDFTITDDVYTYTIKPFLYSRGIQSVDAGSLSQAHVDHDRSSQCLIRDN